MKTVCEIKLAVLIAVVLLGFWSAAPIHADPNHQAVDSPFAVHGSEFSPDLHKKATELYESAKTKLLAFLEKDAKGDLQKVQADDLGSTYALVSRLRRASEQLQILGEPAGTDFERRADSMHFHLQNLIDRSKQLPATQKYIEAFRVFISRAAAARTKIIGELGEQAQKKKWEPAETELYRVYDRLEMGTVLLTPPEIQAIYAPFGPVEVAIRNAMNEIRSTKAKQLLQFAHKETLPHYSSILAAMNLAIEELGSKDIAAWKGERLNAPQLVVRLGDTWREAQVGALKARAIWWALNSRRYAALSVPSSPSIEAQSTDKAAEEYSHGLFHSLDRCGNGSSEE